MTENNIPRLKGSSRIVYIGQTEKSLYTRHHSSSKIKAESKANSQKYNDIVNLYGPMSVYFLERTKLSPSNELSLLDLEGQLLWWYFQNHSEYPPVNYTKTKNRNISIDVELEILAKS